MAKSKSTATPKNAETPESTQSLENNGGFDPMPIEDAVMYYEIASDKFGELAALFGALKQRLGEHGELYELHKLDRMGVDVATDYENQVDCWREQLKEGGFKKVAA